MSANCFNPENVIIAVNCGGEEYTDPDGVVYLADKYYDKGSASDYGLQYDIELTKDEELYQTERWADGDLTYILPFNADKGKIIVILKFSEVYFSAPEQKVFDFAIGNEIILEDIDIFDRVGKAKAYDEYIELEFKDDDNLYYNV